MKPSALFALALLTSASSLTADPKQGTDDEPPLLEKRAAVAAGEIEWIDGTRIPLEGRAFSEGARPYSRLPEAARTRPDLEKVVLNMDAPVGMCFRFRTDSNVLRVRWSLRRKPPYHMANASPLLNAGIDVYRWMPGLGWRFWMTGLPRNQTNEIACAWTPDTPCMIYLPTTSAPDKIEVGVKAGSKIEPLGPRTSGIAKPVVFYGPSMVHGYSSSRPGMVWPNILSRLLDVPTVNQGYNGQARMEPSLCDYMAEIDASAYCFLCCGGQMSVEDMRVKFPPFFRKLHKARPDVPIVVGEFYYTVGPDAYDFANPKRDFMRRLVAELKAEDPVLWKNLYLVNRADMICADGDGTVDAAHFNDRGAWKCAEAFAAVLKRALGL